MEHMTKSKQVNVTLDPNPKGAFKKLGGSQADDWNQRLGNLVASALPHPFDGIVRLHINHRVVDSPTSLETFLAAGLIYRAQPF